LVSNEQWWLAKEMVETKMEKEAVPIFKRGTLGQQGRIDHFAKKKRRKNRKCISRQGEGGKSAAFSPKKGKRSEY